LLVGRKPEMPVDVLMAQLCGADGGFLGFESRGFGSAVYWPTSASLTAFMLERKASLDVLNLG
jgi:hypothetical protein